VSQAVELVIKNNPKAVSHYLAGNEKAIGALIGQVIKLYKFDPVIISDLLKDRIVMLNLYSKVEHKKFTLDSSRAVGTPISKVNQIPPSLYLTIL
jgi:hypothetical protein